MSTDSRFDESQWRDALEDHRRRKDEFFAEHPQSPIPHTERSDFEGLAYYPPDSAARVTATITRHDDPAEVVMETTTGESRTYRTIVTLGFEIDGVPVELAGYRATGDIEGLFVPFRDQTSGETTYGAGRYLEVNAAEDLRDGDTIVVDFNRAYSPFCAYNDAYTCPLPPTENWLDVPIEAGERYEDHSSHGH